LRRILFNRPLCRRSSLPRLIFRCGIGSRLCRSRTSCRGLNRSRLSYTGLNRLWLCGTGLHRLWRNRRGSLFGPGCILVRRTILLRRAIYRRRRSCPARRRPYPIKVIGGVRWISDGSIVLFRKKHPFLRQNGTEFPLKNLRHHGEDNK